MQKNGKKEETEKRLKNLLKQALEAEQLNSQCIKLTLQMQRTAERKWNNWRPMYEKEQSQRQPHQWETVNYEPIEGRAIFFPSYIGHEVEQNLTDVEGQDGYRISISFNSLQIKKEK